MTTLFLALYSALVARTDDAQDIESGSAFGAIAEVGERVALTGHEAIDPEHMYGPGL